MFSSAGAAAASSPTSILGKTPCGFSMVVPGLIIDASSSRSLSILLPSSTLSWSSILPVLPGMRGWNAMVTHRIASHST